MDWGWQRLTRLGKVEFVSGQEEVGMVQWKPK